MKRERSSCGGFVLTTSHEKKKRFSCVADDLMLGSVVQSNKVQLVFPEHVSWRGKHGCAGCCKGVILFVHFADWNAIRLGDGNVRDGLACCWSVYLSSSSDGHVLVAPGEDEMSDLRGPVLHWDDLVMMLVARRKYLTETIAHISTLGGGWASVGDRNKARQFAFQQRNVARLLGDETLELLSNVYIAYGHLYDGRFEVAKSMIDTQATLARKRGDKRQLAIIHAAYIQLDRASKHA